MQVKFCKDQQCKNIGSLLPLTDFPRDRSKEDQRYIYCRECCRRRERERRAAKGARQYQKLQRKPDVIANSPFALSLVYDAIQKGYRTREEIQRHTKLDYDSIGDALTELCFEAKGVVIQNRKYIPIEEVLAA